MSTQYTLNGDVLSAGGLTVTPADLEIAVETRLASGTKAKDVVAVKRTWKFGWTDLPGLDANVRDGGLGHDSLLALYRAGGELTLTIPDEGGMDDTATVMFSGPFEHPRTSIRPFWRFNVGFTLEEV
jgi:hypothetical protein